jgi:addiction module RelE/StbE family toxin
MVKLEWSSGFERALKKWLSKHPADREVIKEKLELFTANPSNPELKNHKLSGQLKGLRAISVAYNCRIVFAMVEENTALLVSIGTHDEVY